MEKIFRVSSKLSLQNGTYTSIFGLVPKECGLSSEESRTVEVRQISEEQCSLLVLDSETKRILSEPDEIPSVEAGQKPLTGKTLSLVKDGESGWKIEETCLSSLTEEEAKEADRLVSRYQPGKANPFSHLDYSTEKNTPLDTKSVLEYFGYTEVSNITGDAEAKKILPDESASDAALTAIELKINVVFEAGEGINKRSTELEGTGKILLDTEMKAPKQVDLNGKLAIHGERKLPDNRIVPYSIVSKFEYQGASSEKENPASPQQ